MCRLVGIVASENTQFGLCLKEAPRSLARLSREHPDGWGIAVFERTRASWMVHKGTASAHADQRFHDIAAQSAGHLLVAHIRQKTVGPTRIENTHPFQRDGWLFAHNGTVKAIDVVRAGASKARLAEVEGDTDSELLFAHFLTRLDEAGLTKLSDEASRAAATRIVGDATKKLREQNVGAFNFLLSDGATCFAHRFGRTLFILERAPSDRVREIREVTESTTLVTKWTQRRHAVLIASEKLTDEPWREVPEGSLLRVDRDPVPTVVLDADGASSAGSGRAA
jgi:predicted glutamine amidotransferase